jgi:hypothetical protein
MKFIGKYFVPKQMDGIASPSSKLLSSYKMFKYKVNIHDNFFGKICDLACKNDRRCGLVVRLPVRRPIGAGFDSRSCQIF